MDVNKPKKPELIVIAGPNGSGKTTVTQKFLHHEWSAGVLYINPDQIANDRSLTGLLALTRGVSVCGSAR